MAMQKEIKRKDIIYQTILSIINVKNFYGQQIHSDKNRYEEIRKLKIDLWEDYTTGCFLDWGNIKNQYKVIGVDLSRQKNLDADFQKTNSADKIC